MTALDDSDRIVDGPHMQEIKPVQRVTLGEQVALQLAEMIKSGRWKPGEKLPSEAELCRAMGVGRSTIREALKSLAFTGMVWMRAGGGTYVSEGPQRLLDGVLRNGEMETEKDLRDICESRLILETALAAMCAERASAAEMKELRDLVEEMERHLDRDDRRFMELDLTFHMTIAGACGNKILIKVLNEVRRALQQWMEKSPESPGSRERALVHHRRILEALEARDPEKAERAMRRHLGDIRLVDLLLQDSGQTGPGR
jgi:GntR family transcriptional repressor for pyruvate dehydrogenase complex